MELPWRVNRETNEIKLVVNDDLFYEAYPNGELAIAKHKKGEPIIHLYDESWEDEKKWLSDNFSYRYGVYEPCLPENLEPDDPYQCVFGKNPQGIYLDRIQRSSKTMELNETHTTSLFDIDKVGIVHTDDGGKTIWLLKYCEWNKQFYNNMKCDVYPENPGWLKLTKTEAIEFYDTHFPNADVSVRSELISKIENETVELPLQKLL